MIRVIKWPGLTFQVSSPPSGPLHFSSQDTDEGRAFLFKLVTDWLPTLSTNSCKFKGIDKCLLNENQICKRKTLKLCPTVWKFSPHSTTWAPSFLTSSLVLFCFSFWAPASLDTVMEESVPFCLFHSLQAKAENTGEQEMADCFRKGPRSEYVSFCRPCGLCCE